MVYEYGARKLLKDTHPNEHATCYIVQGRGLVIAPHEYIEHPMTELEAFQPDLVITMHCSGAGFIETMRHRMSNQLMTNQPGHALHIPRVKQRWVPSVERIHHHWPAPLQ